MPDIKRAMPDIKSTIEVMLHMNSEPYNTKHEKCNWERIHKNPSRTDKR